MVETHQTDDVSAGQRSGAIQVSWPLIHIGYHKAGSSWLQQELFGMPRNWTQVGIDEDTLSDRPSGSFASLWSRAEIERLFVGVDPFAFDAREAYEYFAPGMKAMRHASLVPVLSHERLSGLPRLGGYDSKYVADRLAAVFPEARVLIVIREQKAMITTNWKAYIRRGGRHSVEQYLGRALQDPIGPGFLRHYAYDKLISHYQAVFGQSNVLVLPFELLATTPETFAERVCAFGGVANPSNIGRGARNPSLSGLATSLKRSINRLVIRHDLNATSISSSKLNSRICRRMDALDKLMLKRMSRRSDRKISQRVTELVNHHYAASNKATAQLVNLDLKNLGYDY